ncbi:hypothetical protein C1H46_003089 [Malus baccata]|uniref:Uncharacterized protein n=1 Tax=Malus baccata TaxID=106549 RepID=A0A540NK15_MALBA|nr:hypothetical protein C1H46_003089 [Malus baccata]
MDESYLPRWIGYGFGSLLILNHFVGSTATPAQLGAIPMDQTSIPQGCEQIFVISQNVSDTQEEDLAWAMYILLRNTNTTAVYETYVHVPDSGLWEMLPQGTCSLLVQPILQVQHSSDDEIQKVKGFVLLTSSMGYACSDKDRAWIGALTNKIRGKR